MNSIISKSLQKASGVKNPHLEFSSHEEFGDYTTNVALISGKSSKDILDKLKKDVELMQIIDKIETAGPGFLNFWIKEDLLLDELQEILKQKNKYGSADTGQGETVLVEYSSPNIAKRFSIGHLRSTVIGQALYNMYKFQGYEVVGENHMGDWGTQFGMIIAEIVKHNLDPKKLSVEEMEKLYVEFNAKMADDPSLRDEAKAWFKKLEQGDRQARDIWQAAVDISLKEFNKIWQLLGVKIDNNHGESFYQDKMADVILEAKKKNLAEVGEKGAIIFKLQGMPPGILVKSDQTTTYFTRDLAAIKYRIKTWNPSLFIYEVGSDQILHFRQVFEAARKLGWVRNQQLIHVPHGLVRFKEGKMSTRRGQTVKLEEVLDEAVKKAAKFNSEPNIAQKVGIGAVKYFDLMHAPTSDIIFDWNKIFVLEGNSGPYLQYTFARSQSVLAKSQGKNQKSNNLNNEELAVLRKLIQFPEIIANSAQGYSPNILANYLFELAQKYNNFYNKHKIIGNDFRVELTAGVGQVLQNGLALLGIEAPVSM